MPGLDQTGPQGQGSMTGRRMGRCANKSAETKKQGEPASQSEGGKTPEVTPGKGRGMGSGSGRGANGGRGGRGGRGAGQGSGQGQQKRLRGGA